MSSATPSLPPLDNTFGAVFIGAFFGAILYGMSVVQCMYYFTHYSKDPKYLRILVAVAVFFDTAPVILVIVTLYFYLIKNFANPVALAKLVWTGQPEVIFGALTALLVQCFYIFRLWRLSRSKILAGVLLVISLTEFAINIFWVSKTLRMKTFLQLTTVKNLTMVGNTLQAVIDVILAVSMCYLLHTSRSAFRKTNTLINKWILFFINTGLLTSICAIGVVVSSAAYPNSLIFAAWYTCIGHLYTNSLLAALNGRRIIRGEVQDFDMTIPANVANVAAIETTAPGTVAHALSLETVPSNSDRKH